MPYTLADYARLADSDLKRGVIDILSHPYERPTLSRVPQDQRGL